jgi:outer membrane protein assembly factor BamB
MKNEGQRWIFAVLAMISLGAASAFAAAPTISGFSPGSGILSSTVTITGTNFVSPATVSFNGVASTLVSVSSSTTIHATVPPTAGSGTITVATAGGSAATTSAFTVLPGVGLTPSAVGPPTTAVTLYYSGFGAYEPVDLYFDTDDVALSSASASGAGNSPLIIPATARPGVHCITAVSRRSVNSVQIAFTVRASWPQYGFQPNHKSKNNYENVLSTSTVSSLDEAWQTPGFAGVFCTPAIVNGIVYVGFGDGSIRAFDETTGAQKWSYATGGTSMYSSPAVANGIVYAGSSDDYLYALDAVTGALKWRYQTGSIIVSAPNVVNGIVYFGSYDDDVYALNAATGVLVWKFVTSAAVFSSPAVANGVVYVGSGGNGVYALNALTGATVWQYTATGGINASPVLAGGLVCVGSDDGYLYALDAATGALNWKFNTGSLIDSSAAAVAGAIYFVCYNGAVYSLSANGVLRWSTALPNSTSNIFSPVSLANGVVYVRDQFYTYVLDSNSGTLLTTLRVGSTYGGAAVVDGAVFSGDETDGVLTRYTPNAMLSNFVAPRPDPMQLRPHPLR